MRAIRNFFDQRLWQSLVRLLKQGVTPKELALSVSLGFALGIFPMIGSTTLLCSIFGQVFRLNPVAIQIVNYFTYPLQLAFFVPFFQAGAFLFDAPPIQFSIDEIFVGLAERPLEIIGELWTANLRAVVVWLLVATPLTLVLRRMLTPIFARVALAVDRAPTDT